MGECYIDPRLVQSRESQRRQRRLREAGRPENSPEEILAAYRGLYHDDCEKALGYAVMVYGEHGTDTSNLEAALRLAREERDHGNRL